MRGRIAVSFALLLLPAAALAQTEADEAPDPAAAGQEGTGADASPEAPADLAPSDEEARALFTAGRVAFEHGELERALAHFERAYELSQRPFLLFNIGNTHDRLRHDQEAIDYLSRYLEALPDAPNAEFVRSRIEVLRENVAAEHREAEEREAERARLLAAAHTVDATASDVGIALMIGGGVGLLASIGPIVWLAGTTSQLNACMPRNGCDPRPIAGRQDAAIALTVSFLVTSVLAGGGGLVLFVVSPRPGGTEQTEVACALLPGGVGCGGRF